jgi:hypothetical protein
MNGGIMPLHPHETLPPSYIRPFIPTGVPALGPATHTVHTAGIVVRLTVACLCSAFVASCASLSGYPAPSINEKAELASLQPYFSPEKTNSCADKPDKQCRNDIISGRLRAVDLNYYAFVKALFQQYNASTLGADIAVLGLNAAGAVSGGALTKSALAAASAGIVGVKGAIDADLFYQKTLPALVAQMDAQRKTVLANILKGLSEELDKYPLQQGLGDVDAYYAAGTIPGAISGVITDAGAKSEQADIKITRDQQFVANIDKASTIVDRILKLSPDQALKLEPLMEGHFAERDTDLQLTIKSQNSYNDRLKDGPSAKKFLAFWASMDSRDDKSIDEWQTNLNIVEKQ